MEQVRRPLLALVAAAALVVGCGDEDAPNEPAGGPLVAYERSGGIAGVLEELRIERDGRATVTVGPARDRATFTLDEAELAELEEELEAADLGAADAPPGDPVCSDCFEYRIAYDDFEVTLSDLDRPAPSLEEVLAHLGRLVSDNQPPQSPPPAG